LQKAGSQLQASERHFMLKNISLQARRALLSHMLWALGLAVADAFVNVYIYRISGPGQGIHHVAYFQIWRNLLVPVGFVLATALARRTSTAWAFRAGVLAYEVFYMVVLLLGERSLGLLPLLGSLLGLAMGAYWLGWQVMILDLTKDAQRDRFFSASNFGVALAGMTGGPLAGWFLSRFPGVEGYRWVFFAATLIFLSSALVSMPLSTPALPRTRRLKRLWQVAWHSRPWRRVLFSSLFNGFRDGAFLFLVGLLFFMTTGSEASLGAFGLLVSGLGLAGSYLSGRLIQPDNRAKRMMQGAWVITLAILILAWQVNSQTLLLYGCVTAMLGPLFNVAYSSAQFKVVGDHPRLMRRKADGLILREIPIAAGRVLGNVFLFLFVSGANTPQLRLFMVLVGLMPLIIYWIIKPLFKPGQDQER
jgi:YQGE family putative transporter